MFMFFGGDKNVSRSAIIIDVGSGSVGAAVVLSESNQKQPEILWSGRESFSVKESEYSEKLAQKIQAALFNLLLNINQQGMKSLSGRFSKTKPDLIQINISAPWSYTATKTANLSSSKPFVISEKLMKELSKKADDQTKDFVNTNIFEEKLDLSILSSQTLCVSSKGYVLSEPLNRRVTELTLDQLISVAPKSLLEPLKETVLKVFPRQKIEVGTFMSIYFNAVQKIFSGQDHCLVDITHRATELGIVRDKKLETVTYVNSGIQTIADKLMKELGVPRTEALSFMRENSINSAANFSEAKQQIINEAITEYEKELNKLFAKIGGALSIPKRIFLHTDRELEAFFSQRLKKASDSTSRNSHTIYPVTSKLLTNKAVDDTAILLSATLFHKNTQ